MTDLDPWHERDCAVCGKAFIPKATSRYDALRSSCCGKTCAGRRGAAVLHAEGPLWGRTTGSACKPLDPLDIIHCAKCGLRGHAAGDPEKCLSPVWTYGHASGDHVFLGRRR